MCYVIDSPKDLAENWKSVHCEKLNYKSTLEWHINSKVASLTTCGFVLHLIKQQYVYVDKNHQIQKKFGFVCLTLTTQPQSHF